MTGLRRSAEALVIHLHILGEQGIQQIHAASLRILSEVGVVLTHPGARDMLTAHGAQVRDDRVLFPTDLVEQCLAQCPPTVKTQGRDPARAIVLGDGSLHTHNVGGVPNILDAQGRPRPATREDNIQAARLLDALPNVSALTPFFTPQDVPAASMALWMYYDTLANTTKPVHGPGVQTAREVQALAEMARIACPEGTVSIAVSPLSPLTFPDDVVKAMLEAARLGLPLGPLPCPILGATAPMSIAGGLAQQNAEVLASIVLAQVTRPGLPIVYCGRLSAMNARTGLSVWGNPEIGLIGIGTVEIGHAYRLPVNVYGLCTDAHSPDIQSGYERMLNALLPALAGADEISGIGEMQGGLVGSLVQMMIDNEILDSVKRARRGLQVSQDSLAVDIIARVMDGPRNFLGQKHTVQYLRQGEVLQTRFAGREADRSLIDHASQQAAERLAHHQVPPLDDKQHVALREVIRAVERQTTP